MRAFLREFLTGLGGPPTPAKRLRIGAQVKLAVALPLILLPTALFARRILPHAPDQTHAKWLALGWFGCLAGFIVINLATLALRPERSPMRARVCRSLVYASLVCELGTNAVGTYAIGSITSHGAVFIVMLVAIYRIFYDYRLGLACALLGCALYATPAVLELAGLMPLHPGLPPFDHIFYSDPGTGATLVQVACSAVALTFFSVNYAVNQSLKLHRYITESVLRRYLPPSLVERAARGELSLDAEPERRVVTVMFTDLVGFTALSEQLGADAVGRMLNRYLTEMADLAHAHGATVDKFVGDSVMVVFGAPDALEPAEQARRCVALALEMQRRLGGLPLDRPLAARTGINTGEVVVGNFGSASRSDFTVIGPAVNVAARLEAASRPGRILIGPETARLLGGTVALEPAGALALKGVAAPVEAAYVGS